MTNDDLLSEALLPVTDADGRTHRVTLPGWLAGLFGGSLEQPATAQMHQQTPIYHFLAQLAVIALHRGGSRGHPPTRPSGAPCCSR